MSQPARTPTDASPPPSRAADARLGAIVDSYSFDVERSHLLLQAGFIPALSLRKSRFCTPRIGPAPRRSACFWADAPAASSAPAGRSALLPSRVTTTPERRAADGVALSLPIGVASPIFRSSGTLP